MQTARELRAGDGIAVGGAIVAGTELTGDGESRAAASRGASARWAAVALVAATVLPVIAAVIAVGGDGWLPAGDHATLELRVRDVGGADTPLVGPYSRYGWNHPGPLLVWALAPTYRLLGSASSALLVGAGLCNAIVLAAIGWFAWRRDGLALVALTTACVGVLVASLGGSVLVDPWNPFVTVLPLVLFVLLAWSVVERDGIALPLGIGVASFLVQSHVGYALVVVAVTLTAALLAWHRRAGPSRRSLLTAAAVLVVCWAPVAIDQVAGSANAGEIVGWFASDAPTPVGWATGLGVVARELGVAAPWLGFAEPVNADGGVAGATWWLLAPPVATFTAAALAAWRTRCGATVRFQALVSVTVAAGAVATARITDVVFDYLVRWWWAVGALVVLSTAWSAWSVAESRIAATHPRRRAGMRRAAIGVAATIAVVASGVATAGARDVGEPEAVWERAVAALAHPTLDALPEGTTVLVRDTGSGWGSVADALKLALERGGHPVAVDPWAANRFGPGRDAQTRDPDLTVWVVGGDAIPDYEQLPMLRKAASYEPPPDATSPLAREAFAVFLGPAPADLAR